MEPSTLTDSASAPVILALVMTAVFKVVKSTPQIPNWIIPYLAWPMGAILYSSLLGTWDARTLIFGAMFGGSAVGMNQTARQGIQRVKEDPETFETQEFRRRLEEVKGTKKQEPDKPT